MRKVSRSEADRRWNLFARELEDILAARGCALGRICTSTSVNPAKVLRLRESLSQKQPKCFPLLPTSEVDEIILAFALTPAEQLRLHTSVLVTAMERVLVNRLDPDNALLAAEQLFPIILGVLQQQRHASEGLGLYIAAPLSPPPARPRVRKAVPVRTRE